MAISFGNCIWLCICLLYVCAQLLEYDICTQSSSTKITACRIKALEWKLPSSVAPTDTVVCSEIVLWWAESHGP